MSKPLLRSLPPPSQCERYLQRCARQRIPSHPRDDLRHLIPSTPPPRPFSSCPPQRAGMRSVMPKAKERKSPSMSVARAKEQANALNRGGIPNDVGLIEGTFIMPTGKNRPSWTSNFRERYRLERFRLRTRIGEWAQNLLYRYFQVRPRPRLHHRTATATAKRLHHEMYSAFASGDLSPVQEHICTGLLTSLRARIAQRPPNTHLLWILHRYVSAPRLVSYKTGLLPGADGRQNPDKHAQNAFVQAVVRIHSQQSLQHVKTVTQRDRATGQMTSKDVLVDGQGRDLPAHETPEAAGRKNMKETVEYFVIQRQMKRSKEGPWMVWGTAEETTLEKAEASWEKMKKLRTAVTAARRGGGAAAAA